MKKNILLLILFFISTVLFAQLQVNSIFPYTATRSQTLTTTITFNNAIFNISSPPHQTQDIYLEQSGYIIYTDYFDTFQLYIDGGNGTWDSLYTNFTIPFNAPTGSYDVHVTSYVDGVFPWDPPIASDNVLTDGFLISSSPTCLVPYSTLPNNITNNSVLINWSNYTPADTFRIRYFPISTGIYQYLDVNGSGAPTSAPLSGLLPGSQYNFQVSSICAGISGGYSAVDSFTTLSQPVNCIVPFDLISSGITNTSATVSWSTLVTADTFLIRYSVDGTSNYLYKTINGAGHSTTLSTLQPATTYQYQVSSVCLGVSTGYSPSSTFTTTGVCVRPVGLTTTSFTNTTANISWSANVTADTFMVRYFETGTVLYGYQTINGASHSTVLTGLEPGTSYQFQVSSVCLGISSGYSATSSFTTTTVHILCARPYDVTATNVLNTSALIGWSPYVDADTFRIRYAVNGTANYLYKNVNGSAGNSAGISQLQAATTYMVQVSSVCSGQGGRYSLPAFFTTASVADSCSLPYGLFTTLITNTTAVVHWTPYVLADTFRVRYAINGTSNYIWKNIPGSAGNSASLTGLQPATTYKFQVSAICLGVSSGYSTVDQFVTNTTPVSCVVPFGLTNSNTTNVSTTVNWSPYVTADTFRIRYREFGTSVFHYIDVNGTGGVSSYTISNLDPNTFYTYQVSSICLGISSGYSSTAFFSTLNIPAACARPYGLSASNVTNSSALVSWGTLVTADTFRIRYSINGTSAYQYFNHPGTSGNSAVLNGLLPNRTYQFQVSSICTGASSGYSYSVLFVTANTPVACTTPYGLSNSNVINVSADINWTPLVTADSFMIRYSVFGTTNYSWLKISGAGGVTGTTLTGLQATTIYQWQVRSICAGVSTSIYSASDVFTTGVVRLANPALSALKNVVLYPNPAHEICNLKFSSDKNDIGFVQLKDIHGRILVESKYEIREGENTLEINTSGISTGVYFITFKTLETLERFPVVIE